MNCRDQIVDSHYYFHDSIDLGFSTKDSNESLLIYTNLCSIGFRQSHKSIIICSFHSTDKNRKVLLFFFEFRVE